jgi:hypothetical protein
MACIQIARQDTLLLSFFRLVCGSRPACSRIIQARFDRRDSDRASSRVFVGFRVL